MSRIAPSMVTGKVLLRDVTKDDIPIFFEHQLEPEANQMAAFPARDKDSFTAHWLKILADETSIKQTILLDGQVVGNIVSFDQSGQPEVGYWIGKQHWGKGIATAALAALLDSVPTRPLYAHVAKHNIASMRVLEKCGFRVCGEDIGDAGGHGAEIAEWILKLEENENDTAD